MTPGPAAPAQRIAAFRIVLGVFTTAYLSIRSPMFAELGDRWSKRFQPVGVFRLIDRPLAGLVNDSVLLGTIFAGCLFSLGWRFRIIGPLFAAGLVLLTSHRSSWGQLLHFENLMAMHVIVIGLTRSADVWSIDANRRHKAGADDPVDGVRYGWPLQIAAIIVVVTYAIAGLAKLRYGGLEWVTGDTLRNHIASSATRLELLGESPAPAARLAVGAGWLLRPAAAVSVLIELAAPLALVGRRWRNSWVGVTWLMHVGIYATMLVGFPSPLFLVAFAPMFDLERIVQKVRPPKRSPATRGGSIGRC
jgi:hypothetical protein